MPAYRTSSLAGACILSLSMLQLFVLRRQSSGSELHSPLGQLPTAQQSHPELLNSAISRAHCACIVKQVPQFAGSQPRQRPMVSPDTQHLVYVCDHACESLGPDANFTLPARSTLTTSTAECSHISADMS